MKLLPARKRFTAQARQLARMGIEHRLNATGEPIVSRAHFEQVMGSHGGLVGRDDVLLNLNFLDKSGGASG